MLLLGSYLLLLIVELLNTGIEVVVDRIGLERHALSGFAKDLGSAAVLLSLLLVAIDLGPRAIRLTPPACTKRTNCDCDPLRCTRIRQ